MILKSRQYVCLMVAVWVLGFGEVSSAKTSDLPGAHDSLLESGTAQDWKVSIGAGEFFKPEFQGSEDYEWLMVPYFDIRFKDTIFLNVKDGLKVNLYKQHGFTLASGLDYHLGRDNEDNARLDGFNEIDSTLEGIIYAKYKLHPIHFTLRFAHDLMDGHEGYTFTPGVYVKFPITKKAFGKLSLDTTIVSDSYMQTYFGVDGDQVGRSPTLTSEYNTSGGFKDVGLAFSSFYELDQHWGIVTGVAYNHLVGDAGKSPIVEAEAQFSGGAALSYTF